MERSCVLGSVVARPKRNAQRTLQTQIPSPSLKPHNYWPLPSCSSISSHWMRRSELGSEVVEPDA